MPSLGIKLSVCILAASSAFAQSAPTPAPLAFDVASVRPSKPGSPQHTNVPLDSGNVYGSISPDDARSAAGGLFIATHQSLWRYISFAYKLTGTQALSLRFNMFSGAPNPRAPFWVTGSFDAPAEFFDISARAPADTSMDQMAGCRLCSSTASIGYPRRLRGRSRICPCPRPARHHRSQSSAASPFGCLRRSHIRPAFNPRASTNNHALCHRQSSTRLRRHRARSILRPRPALRWPSHSPLPRGDLDPDHDRTRGYTPPRRR